MRVSMIMATLAAASEAASISINLLSMNIYYQTIRERANSIARHITSHNPDIASIQEMWGEKAQVLGEIRGNSGRNYAFAGSRNTERWWDGDILFDADLFRVLEDDVIPYDGERGLSWAMLQHKSSGIKLLAYGIHPLCCQGDEIRMDDMEMATNHMAETRGRVPDIAGIVWMGDFNSGMFDPANQLIKQGQLDVYGRVWKVPITFADTWGDKPEVPTSSYSNKKIDHVYVENNGRFTVQSSNVVDGRAATGTDHMTVLARVTLSDGGSAPTPTPGPACTPAGSDPNYPPTAPWYRQPCCSGLQECIINEDGWRRCSASCNVCVPNGADPYYPSDAPWFGESCCAGLQRCVINSDGWTRCSPDCGANRVAGEDDIGGERPTGEEVDETAATGALGRGAVIAGAGAGGAAVLVAAAAALVVRRRRRLRRATEELPSSSSKAATCNPHYDGSSA